MNTCEKCKYYEKKDEPYGKCYYYKSREVVAPAWMSGFGASQVLPNFGLDCKAFEARAMLDSKDSKLRRKGDPQPLKSIWRQVEESHGRDLSKWEEGLIGKDRLATEMDNSVEKRLLSLEILVGELQKKMGC